MLISLCGAHVCLKVANAAHLPTPDFCGISVGDAGDARFTAIAVPVVCIQQNKGNPYHAW